MTIAARRIEPRSLHHETATVAGLEPDGRYRLVPACLARRAASCLVAPADGDTVAVAVRADGRDVWILAVLDRAAADEVPTPIAVEGDVTLRARNGQVRLEGDRGVSVTSPRTVDVLAGRFGLMAADAQVAIDTVQVVGKAMVSRIDDVRHIARKVEMVADQLSQRLKRSLRRIEEVAHVRANVIDHVAEATYSVRSDHAVVTAERLVKVDGKQVHIG
ncbi:MAG: DUF3540 domain-containing protein [Myxococcota bacterium]